MPLHSQYSRIAPDLTADQLRTGIATVELQLDAYWSILMNLTNLHRWHKEFKPAVATYLQQEINSYERHIKSFTELKEIFTKQLAALQAQPPLP